MAERRFLTDKQGERVYVGDELESDFAVNNPIVQRMRLCKVEYYVQLAIVKSSHH